MSPETRPSAPRAASPAPDLRTVWAGAWPAVCRSVVMIGLGQAHFEHCTTKPGSATVLEKPYLPAMRAHKIGSNGETKARAAGARGRLKRLEQTRARGGRHAGAAICDIDQHFARLASRRKPQTRRGIEIVARSFERFHGVAAQIQQHTKHLFLVRGDFHLARHVVDRFDAALARHGGLNRLGDELMQRDAL